MATRKHVTSVLEVANRRQITQLEEEYPDIEILKSDLTNHMDIAKGNAHIIENIGGLLSALNNKAEVSHTHIIEDVEGLSIILDSKAETFSGYTGSITVVTSVDFTSQVSTSKTLTFTNGILDSIS